jgi:Divergent InlB B-repeat domain
MRRGACLIPLALAVLAVAGAGARAGGPAFAAQSLRIFEVPHYGLVSRAAVDWCGTGQATAVDRKPDVDLSSPRQVHVTYAIPADAADQFASFGPKLATDAAAMDTWWRGQDPTRTIRFDLFAFPGCATKFGKLDVGFIRLPRVGALYVGDSGVDRLLDDLAQLGGATSQKNLVYYDGPPVYDSFVCGTTFVPNSATSQGGYAGIAFVWLRSLCGGDVGAGGLNAAVAVHELIHGLGALVGANSPNECAPPDDGHVCDNTLDVLYPSANASTRIATQILDFNRDDYYGHSHTWFDVQDSGWLTHLPQLALAVAVQRAGSATGVVHLTAPSTFDCAASCALDFDSGLTATLAAQASAGSRFLGWTGACSGTGSCTVTMDSAKSVGARFAASVSRFSVSISGKGRVTSTPAGIACPKRCSTAFPSTSTVRLRATPSAGQRFAGWSGSCHGTGTCTLKADRSRSAHASFKKKR